MIIVKIHVHIIFFLYVLIFYHINRISPWSGLQNDYIFISKKAFYVFFLLDSFDVHGVKSIFLEELNQTNNILTSPAPPPILKQE